MTGPSIYYLQVKFWNLSGLQFIYLHQYNPKYGYLSLLPAKFKKTVNSSINIQLLFKKSSTICFNISALSGSSSKI